MGGPGTVADLFTDFRIFRGTVEPYPYRRSRIRTVSVIRRRPADRRPRGLQAGQPRFAFPKSKQANGVEKTPPSATRHSLFLGFLFHS